MCVESCKLKHQHNHVPSYPSNFQHVKSVLIQVVLLIVCFTLFEFPFPVDNNVLYLYFKVYLTILTFNILTTYFCPLAAPVPLGGRGLHKLPGSLDILHGGWSGASLISSAASDNLSPVCPNSIPDQSGQIEVRRPAPLSPTYTSFLATL